MVKINKFYGLYMAAVVGIDSGRNVSIIIIIMIVMHRPQKEYDVHVLISYIYKLSACDS